MQEAKNRTETRQFTIVVGDRDPPLRLSLNKEYKKLEQHNQPCSEYSIELRNTHFSSGNGTFTTIDHTLL